MKISFINFILFCFVLSCKDAIRKIPEDPVSAGRYFIDASLKGDYKEARKYILADSLNLMYFERASDFYKEMKPQEKEGYKNANIIIENNGIEKMSDSVTIIHYSNTFKNKSSTIKLVRFQGEWLIDFKYTFNGNL